MYLYNYGKKEKAFALCMEKNTQRCVWKRSFGIMFRAEALRAPRKDLSYLSNSITFARYNLNIIDSFSLINNIFTSL